MTREALADRLVNYADAVAAFSVVNSLAFIVALTDVDVRCSLVNLLGIVVVGQIAFSTVFTIAAASMALSDTTCTPPIA